MASVAMTDRVAKVSLVVYQSTGEMRMTTEIR